MVTMQDAISVARHLVREIQPSAVVIRRDWPELYDCYLEARQFLQKAGVTEDDDDER